MSETKKLNCRAPQCGYWREDSGCSLDEHADNGEEICGKGEERYENQIFVIVEGGLVQAIYSDKPPSDLSVEYLDIDNAKADDENENALTEMRERIEVIEGRYHQIF